MNEKRSKVCSWDMQPCIADGACYTFMGEDNEVVVACLRYKGKAFQKSNENIEDLRGKGLLEPRFCKLLDELKEKGVLK